MEKYLTKQWFTRIRDDENVNNGREDYYFVLQKYINISILIVILYMFSKPLYHLETDNNHLTNEFIVSEHKEKSPKSDKKLVNTKLSYVDFIGNSVILKKYKVPELKSIAKHLRIHITGSKHVLIERIETHFNKVSKSIKIQKIFRGFILRKSFILRGEAFKEKSLCVNSTDFYTLEPLHEIDFELFFSYKDSQNFHYGFNITSLIKLMKNKSVQLLNPYNREIIPQNVISNIGSLYKKIQLLFPSILEPEDIKSLPNTGANQELSGVGRNRERANIQPSRIYGSNMVLNLETTNLMQEISNKINEIREKSVPVRIQELFMEIDQLGNYTNAEWFSTLTIRDYIRLYRNLYDIWNYRAQLSYEMKRKICLLNDPFLGIFNQRIYSNDISFSQIQEACLKVFENMVYTGIDIEHRKIGTMHSLSALTIVSLDARNAMPWLYESLVF
jgi:hypothetical protein